MKPKEIRVIFDGPPAHESGRFIEVENENGHSISAGKWVQTTGYWMLVFTREDFSAEDQRTV